VAEEISFLIHGGNIAHGRGLKHLQK
jgi:hypothetical protein